MVNVRHVEGYEHLESRVRLLSCGISNMVVNNSFEENMPELDAYAFLT